MKLRTIVVDDEPLARERICGLLENEADVEVIAECDGGAIAVSTIRELRPDLVFLDVQMPEVDGFDVLETLREDEIPPTIFLTAFEEHAIRAFEVHALDYLLKPCREDRLQQSLERARELQRTRQKSENWRRPIQQLLSAIESPQNGRLVIRSPGKVVFVDYSDIDWFEAAGNYVLVHVGGKSHLMRETMAELERKLPTDRFVRIHRSTIIPFDRVSEVRSTAGGDAKILLTNRRELTLSRRYRKRFEDALPE